MPYRHAHDSRHVARDSAVAMVILGFVIGAMVGFASGWETSAMRFRERVERPAAPAAAAPTAAAGAPSAETLKTLPEEASPAIVAAYRGVVDAAGADGLKVTVMEGVAGRPQVTLLTNARTSIVAFKPAPVPPSGEVRPTSKGLPPPPKPPAEPYAAEPMAADAFRRGDVVEFTTSETVDDGAAFTVGKLAWIMNLLDRSQQGGAVGDGTAAPPLPKK
ncbi:MAG: hypothetical protein RL272_517 [Candidatus Parcubacteria bacterium]|jgi:hypothetical protein